ncbi:MAG: clan AA aspartic protease [Nitrospirae bacterium]|nr:clan AA aspartic protease [Nitrospirota bacterium]
MGLTRVTVTLKAMTTSKKEYREEFLVDTGATDSMAPAGRLRAIGIRPLGKTSYELADGTVKELDFGAAVIEFMGDITAGRVVFGPDGVDPILGVTALESTGIAVDPKTHSLKRMPAISLKRAG